MKYTVEVKIKEIDVDEDYFSIDYEITINGKLHKTDVYESDWGNGDSVKRWKQRLENGLALEYALQDFEMSP